MFDFSIDCSLSFFISHFLIARMYVKYVALEFTPRSEIFDLLSGTWQIGQDLFESA